MALFILPEFSLNDNPLQSLRIIGLDPKSTLTPLRRGGRKVDRLVIEFDADGATRFFPSTQNPLRLYARLLDLWAALKDHPDLFRRIAQTCQRREENHA